MLAEIKVEEQAKWYGLYSKLHIIVFIGILVIFTVWGILDACCFDSTKVINNLVVPCYGVLRFDARFHALSLWFFVGVFLGFFGWFLTRILLAGSIQKIETLKVIALQKDIEEVKKSAKNAPPSAD